MIAQVFIYRDFYFDPEWADLVCEVPIGELPEDETAFAREHGGDFIYIKPESFQP